MYSYFLCHCSCTFTSLWAMSMWWRYSMAVPMSCMISDASDGQRWQHATDSVRVTIQRLISHELLQLTSLCEGLVTSGLNATEQLPSFHAESKLTKRSELGPWGECWQITTFHHYSHDFITKQIIVPRYFPLRWVQSFQSQQTQNMVGKFTRRHNLNHSIMMTSDNKINTNTDICLINM